MYVARDKDGSVFLYSSKPKKSDEIWCGASWLPISNYALPKSFNPRWEDNEPIKVKIVRKNK